VPTMIGETCGKR